MAINIKDLREARSVELFAREIAKTAKTVNQQLYRLEKAGLTAESNSYNYAKLETGKQKPRFSVVENTYKKMDLKELEQVARTLNKHLDSPTGTVAKIKKRKKAKIENLAKTQTGNDSKKQKKYEKFLQSGGLSLLKHITSDQLYDEYEKANAKGISDKDFIETFNKYNVKGEFDYGAIEKTFNKIMEKKKASSTGKAAVKKVKKSKNKKPTSRKRKPTKQNKSKKDIKNYKW